MTNMSRKSRKFLEDILKEKVSGFAQVDIAVLNELYNKFSGMVLLLVAKAHLIVIYPKKLGCIKQMLEKKNSQRNQKVSRSYESQNDPFVHTYHLLIYATWLEAFINWLSINKVNLFHSLQGTLQIPSVSRIKINIFRIVVPETCIFFWISASISHFSLFNCESNNLAFILLYSTIYIFSQKLSIFLCKILWLFLLIFQGWCIVLFLCYQSLQQLLEILFVELHLGQHIRLFVYLNQLKLVCNCLWHMYNLINIPYYNLHLILLILFLFYHTVLLNHYLVDYENFFHQLIRYNFLSFLLEENIFYCFLQLFHSLQH